MRMKNLSVVLVEPQGALNIGSVCRVMMNFGCSDLRLVNPQADPYSEDVRRMALKAFSILEQATVHGSLEKALKDCLIALGTTRRFGKYRQDFLHPDQAASLIAPVLATGRVALVFGREDKGLRTGELDLCQRLVTIPASEEFPSLNLAQAVGLCLYEIGRAVVASSGKPNQGKRLASNNELEEMFGHMGQGLLESGFLNPQNPHHLMHTLRRIFGRAGLDSREVRILRGLWQHLRWLEGERRKLSGDEIK
ncbi:MAG: RNA methyltransferase [Deltaproteobacteria bacterium]|nr:RNA methyltransferase [Deltaproteobacteria bacterium]